MDNSDIKYIQSTYKTKPTVDELKSKDVFIEVCDKSEIKELLDEPVLAKTSDSKTYKGLIASSQIPVCYGFEGNSYKDLNGDKYYPNSPSYETIKNMNDTVAEKQSKFENLYAIEYKVKTKLENTVSNFDKAILDKNSKMENVLKNIKVMWSGGNLNATR